MRAEADFVMSAQIPEHVAGHLRITLGSGGLQRVNQEADRRGYEGTLGQGSGGALCAAVCHCPAALGKG
jgi:hypothetical protein